MVGPQDDQQFPSVSREHERGGVALGGFAGSVEIAIVLPKLFPGLAVERREIRWSRLHDSDDHALAGEDGGCAQVPPESVGTVFLLEIELPDDFAVTIERGKVTTLEVGVPLLAIGNDRRIRAGGLGVLALAFGSDRSLPQQFASRRVTENHIPPLDPGGQHQSVVRDDGSRGSLSREIDNPGDILSLAPGGRIPRPQRDPVLMRPAPCGPLAPARNRSSQAQTRTQPRRRSHGPAPDELKMKNDLVTRPWGESIAHCRRFQPARQGSTAAGASWAGTSTCPRPALPLECEDYASAPARAHA